VTKSRKSREHKIQESVDCDKLKSEDDTKNLSIRWRSVVSFMPRPLYPRYQLDRRLSVPQSRSGRGGENKKFLHYSCWESNPGRPAHSPVTLPNELFRLPKQYLAKSKLLIMQSSPAFRSGLYILLSNLFSDTLHLRSSPRFIQMYNHRYITALHILTFRFLDGKQEVIYLEPKGSKNFPNPI
jgi:hypothetical protein